MTIPNTRPWRYRALALAAFVIAQLIVLAVPLKMEEPGDWGFQYAARNFAQGHLSLTDEQYIEQYFETEDAGGYLYSYGRVAEDCWALTWAPGYVFYLMPFECINVPQLGASLLSMGLVAVLYLLLARLKDEKTALLGVVLLLFTPLYLAMWQRVYMDAFAALALCGMGGGLYLYYWLNRARLSLRIGTVILFAAGLLLLASVAVRYTNAVIAAVFGIHFLVMAIRLHLRRERFLPLGLFFVLGAVLPLSGLLIYQGVVFGAPFNSGSGVAQLPVHFVWDYAPEYTFKIVRGNIIQLWAPLLTAMPIIMAATPSLAAITYGKGFFSRRPDICPELPVHIYHVLWGWLVAVFGLYVMYEWAAFQAGGQLPFPLLTRFYLPALFPLVIITALMFRRVSTKLWGGALAVLVVLGVVFFVQASRIRVQFMTEVFPPSLSLPASSEMAPEALLEEVRL